MSDKTQGNIFENLPDDVLDEELFTTLFEKKGYRMERIISTGQTTPEGQWYDQSNDEWVLLLQGDAKLLFEYGHEIKLTKGDYIFIPAHKRHRVLWTSTEQTCVWLALHIDLKS